MTLVLTLLLTLVAIFPRAAYSQVTCDPEPGWSNTIPEINETHVFCGEWSRNRPKGFHSRPGGDNPDTVETLTVTAGPNPQGIYTVRWTYDDRPSPEKFSSMFPDSCTQSQVIESIKYAVENPSSCPQAAPTWARCGLNAPTNPTASVCSLM